jgi:SAM-dependent methyltransferase
MLVLDIGTGTGLLAMMAARAGAREVVACEMDHHLAEMAREIVALNGFADRIRVVARKSTDLAIGRDLPRRADLIVSEILDSALVGEGMLPAMRHALAELAVPGARVIPGGATMYGALVRVPRLRTVNPVARIEGFDLSPFDRLRNRGAGLPTDLDSEEHAFVSAPEKLFEFDFTRPVESPRERTIALRATGAGDAQALALWYELALDPTIKASTGPGGALKHWQPTLFFLDQDRELAAGEEVAVQIGHDDRGWWFTLAKVAAST